MKFTLPDPKPYPGYEIERFEDDGGHICFKSGASDDNLQKKRRNITRQTPESTRSTEKEQ